MILIPFYTLGNTIYCKNGQVLSIHGDFCQNCQECPLELFSSFAMSSNCSKTSNHFCTVFQGTSKICMNKVDVSITDYCSSHGLNDPEPWVCPKANKGLNFEQCYDP